MTCWLCGFETTKLTTNAEAPTCKNGPCQICIAVSNVDEEINQAVATLQRLLAKRCDLRSEQNRVHGTLIHRLPTELKNHIFQLIPLTRNEWGGRGLPSVGPAPISYTSVCRDWRDIAWSNPSLWSTIQIKLIKRKASSDPSSPRVNFVRDYILRSQASPLTLHIFGHEVREEEWKDLIDIISQSSNRWHSLSLDIPSSLLRAFHRSNIQCHLLKNLRIIGDGGLHGALVPLSNFSPENIEIVRIPFQSLQISWNHLTSAKVIGFDFEDLTKLFQHASQMTYCYISDAYDDGSIPSIIHHRLKKLAFVEPPRAAGDFLGYLTLPCLEEFHAEQMFPLKYLFALVHRSSCPLSRIAFDLKSVSEGDWDLLDYLDPLPGITDLVVQNVKALPHVQMIQKLVLEKYCPDLRHLTLRLEPFHLLWDEGVIPLLLDPKRPRLDGATNGRHRRILVIDQDRTDEARNVGKQLKALELNVSLREDGFEILMPCVNTDLLASHLPLQLAR